ncbi:hypothetical protein MACH16_16740 [Marinomonas pontica]|uniref:Uncharacterized protein n=1 Tax=Marinomonas pontica TaxID=264739 RepID=A0ABM8FCU5_9GAMM|nr:hypothetical protein MACH16_16740 [Marinomonas pontica]
MLGLMNQTQNGSDPTRYTSGRYNGNKIKTIIIAIGTDTNDALAQSNRVSFYPKSAGTYLWLFI